jgi:hypothetical protein
MTAPEEQKRSEQMSKDQGKGKQNGRQSQPSRPQGHITKPVDPAAVPILKYGVGNNFYLFKKRLAIACMEKYKNLGRIIVDEKYYEPPKVDEYTI